MPIPKSGQKNIPIKDWKRFLRVADWFERTVEQGNGTRQSSYGQSLIVKTPVDGIDARSDTTISSATCIKCVAAETSTPGERTIHETDEELVVYNAEEQDVPGELFVNTTLSPKGTRYVDTPSPWQRPFELKDAMPTSGSVAAGQQATAHPLDADGNIDLAVDREFEVVDDRGEFRGRAYVSSESRGSQGVARWSHAAQEWRIVTLQPHALRISGTTAGTVSGGAFTAVSTPVIMFPSGALAMEDLTTASLIKNPFGLNFANGDLFHAVLNESATQWEAVVPSGGSGSPGIIFPIDLTQTGGSQGTDTTAASWSYTVDHGITGVELATLQNPVSGAHNFRRPAVGQMVKATAGYAHYSLTGVLTIGWINEVADQEVCATS